MALCGAVVCNYKIRALAPSLHGFNCSCTIIGVMTVEFGALHAPLAPFTCKTSVLTHLILMNRGPLSCQLVVQPLAKGCLLDLLFDTFLSPVWAGPSFGTDCFLVAHRLAL